VWDEEVERGAAGEAEAAVYDLVALDAGAQVPFELERDLVADAAEGRDGARLTLPCGCDIVSHDFSLRLQRGGKLKT